MPYYYKGSPVDVKYNGEIEEPVSAVHYTVVIDKHISDPFTRVTYKNDCFGMEPMECVEDSSGVKKVIDTKNWENVWPFNAVKPCVLEGGVFKGYVDPKNFKAYEDGTLIGSNSSTSFVDIMIEIPKIYYCIETIDDKIYIDISNTKIDDKYVCNAHVYDGQECDKIYIAAYHSVDKTYNGEKTWFSANGIKVSATSSWNPDYDGPLKQKEEGYRLLCFDQMVLLQCLFMLATKSTDSTNSYGRGRYTTSISSNGICDTDGMYSGATASNRAMKFMGIENLYGNVWTRVEGLAIRTAPDYSEYTIYKRDPYSSVPFARDGEGYPSERNPLLDGIAQNREYLINPYGNTKYGFLPQSLEWNGIDGASRTTYFCDTVDVGPHYGMWWGGDYRRGLDSGIFCTRLDINETTSGYYNGYRLVYYPI